MVQPLFDLNTHIPSLTHIYTHTNTHTHTYTYGTIAGNDNVTYKGCCKIVLNGKTEIFALKSKVSFHLTAWGLSYFAVQHFEKHFDEILKENGFILFNLRY